MSGGACSEATLALAIVLHLATVTPAHELGVTQVSADMRADGRYQFDIAVDPDALLTRLEVQSGAPISVNLSDAERDRRIESLGRVFLDRIDLRFDGTPLRSQFEYVPGERSWVRLTGRWPPHARTWTFSHNATIGAFAMTVRKDGGPEETVWLEGGRPSPPLSLAVRRTVQDFIDSAAWLAVITSALAWNARRRVVSARRGSSAGAVGPEIPPPSRSCSLITAEDPSRSSEWNDRLRVEQRGAVAGYDPTMRRRVTNGI